MRIALVCVIALTCLFSSTTQAALKATPHVPLSRYANVVRKLKELQYSHARFAHTFTLGTNDDGADILALRISTTPMHTDPAKVGFLLVSAHHGNELATPDFALHFTEEL